MCVTCAMQVVDISLLPWGAVTFCNEHACICADRGLTGTALWLNALRLAHNASHPLWRRRVHRSFIRAGTHVSLRPF